MAGLGIVDVLARGIGTVDAAAAAAAAEPASSDTEKTENPAPSAALKTHCSAGLVHTLTNMLLKTAYEPHEMSRLLATALPLPPQNGDDDGSGDIAGRSERRPSVQFVDALLDLLLGAAPDDIAGLMLRSSMLRDAAGERMCAALRTKQRLTVEDRFCLLWQSVRRPPPSPATTPQAAADSEHDAGQHGDGKYCGSGHIVYCIQLY